jgi:hypothetical protein
MVVRRSLLLVLFLLVSVAGLDAAPVPRPDVVVIDDLIIGFDCSEQTISTVTGTLTVSGTLQLAATGIPCPAGRVYILIENDGTDPIIGTFDGIPEGGIIFSADQRFRISYTGGSGNDLTATALGPDEVPALDHWGLLLLSALLAGAAAMVLRR